MVLNLYRHQYTVSFDTGEGTTVDDEKIDVSEHAWEPEEVPEAEGKVFIGWYVDEDFTEEFDFENTEIWEDTTVYARYGVAYDIEYDLDGGTEPVPPNPTKYAEESKPIELRQPTRSGYVFTGWSGTGLEGANNLEVTIPTGSTGPRNYKAHWQIEDYTIKYELNKGIATNPLSYTVEDQFTLNNPVRFGYDFIGWSGTALDGEDNTEVTIVQGSTGDREYTAHYEAIPWKIEYELHDGEADNPEVYYSDDNTFTLQNPVKIGYKFTGWSGTDLTGEDNLEVVIKSGSYGDRQYEAHYEERIYNVTYVKTGGTIEDEDKYTSYTYGHGFTLPTPKYEGYEFKGWFNNINFDGPEYKAILNTDYGDKVFYAKWVNTKTNEVVKPEEDKKDKKKDKEESKSEDTGTYEKYADTGTESAPTPASTAIEQKAKLPQTGQNWPQVYTIVVVGLVIILLYIGFKTNSKWFNRLLLASGILVTALGIFLASRNIQDDVQAAEISDGILQVLRDSINTDSKEPTEVEIYTTTIPEVLIDDVSYGGYLDLPTLGLQLPVSSDWSYPQLKSTPCRYQGSPMTCDFIICGHNYKSHFGNLNKLSVGDSITYMDVDGYKYIYEVTDIETLDSYAVEEMESGDWDMTLFTCTIGGQSRVTIRCNLLTRDF